jgi:predicted Ser/Thr protein kinase
MAITIQCPNPACRATASVAEALGGRGVKCKRCGTAFTAQPTLAGQPADTTVSPPSAPAGDPFPTLPAEFGRYRVLQLLGKGGMGAVYLAEDSQLGRRVALKLPSFAAGASPERVERFLREARSAAALHHPNICTLYDAGREGGRPYLTMAYLEGRSLADAIDPDRPMPQRQAAALARKVAEALGHAHERGVVHRDLKPANVMLTAAGEPVVMDFGLAKRLAEEDAGEAKLTRDGAVMGTPDYMAPEQVRGETDRIGPPTDVYALGVMLFELLTGQPPYQGHVGAVMGQILAAPVPSARELRPDIDERLEAICRRAMAKEPGQRFPSMAAFAEALGQHLASARKAQPTASRTTEPFRDLSEPAPGQRPRTRATARPSRWPLLVGAGVAGLVFLLAALGVVLLTGRAKHGDVVVELSDPAAPVGVKVDGEKVELPGQDWPLSLTAGEHVLTVTGTDYETATQSFTVKKGEKQVVKVTLRPKQVVNATAPPKQGTEVQPPKGTPSGDTEPVVPPAYQVPKPAEDWGSLFNGKDLDGWRKFRGKEPGDKWRVKDGILTLLPQGGKEGGDIVTAQQYDNFEFRFEWKVTPGANSGILYRVSEEGAAPHDTGHEYQILDNERNPDGKTSLTSAASCYGVYGPARDVTKPVGEWNQGRIVASGKHVEHWLNGTKVVEFDVDSADWKQRVARRANAARLGREPRGHIVLQDHGNEVAFRNLAIRLLTETKPSAGGTPPAEDWVSLFNGKDLTGWSVAKGEAKQWTVKDGDLIGVAEGNARDQWLLTDKDYDNFVLRFEYQLRQAAKASSGVTFRAVPTEWLHPIKLMDDGDRSDWSAKNGERTGCLWSEDRKKLPMAPPKRNARLKPAGEWNEVELTLNGKALTLTINGEQVQNLDLSEFPTLTRASGRIGLQSHTSIVRFRNIRVKRLPGPAGKP